MVKIDNLSGRALWVQLTDGTSVDLSPRVCPVSIPKREVDVNTSLKKLLALSVVRVISEAGQSDIKTGKKETIDSGASPEQPAEVEAKTDKKAETTAKAKK